MAIVRTAIGVAGWREAMSAAFAFAVETTSAEADAVHRVAARKGYGQFCPVAVASEIFAERWPPLILRELFSGSRRFNEMRSGMPLISRTLLGQRLRELEDAGVIRSSP